MIRLDVPSDHPIGGWHERLCSAMLPYVFLDIGLVALTVFCFVLLDLYVLGCEKI